MGGILGTTGAHSGVQNKIFERQWRENTWATIGGIFGGGILGATGDQTGTRSKVLERQGARTLGLQSAECGSGILGTSGAQNGVKNEISERQRRENTRATIGGIFLGGR